MAKIETISDVARWRLCLGCGTCYSTCPEQKVSLIDVEDDGIRPFIQTGGCGSCDFCVKACPGIRTSIIAAHKVRIKMNAPPHFKKWGRFLEVWEGYASDPEIRFKGSSGGLCTALSLFCIEQRIGSGVFHVGADPERPWKNRTIRSSTRNELIVQTGSRYSPASPCDGFRLMETANGRSVFVGKPCDVAGLRMAHELRPKLVKNTALAIGFFCAGTPATKGTLELLKNHGVEPVQLADFRYRGMGWPGMATAYLKDGSQPPIRITYNDSWGFVQKYRQFRCYLCPDLTAEFADISVGDPWYREVGEDDPGRSLILIRTEKGREIFHQALQQGYITVEPADPSIIYRSQESLLGKRQAIWGRLLAMKLLGIPYPKLEGFHLFDNWMELSSKEKIKSILGTVKRIILRNYFKPVEYEYKNGSWLTVHGSQARKRGELISTH